MIVFTLIHKQDDVSIAQIFIHFESVDSMIINKALAALITECSAL